MGRELDAREGVSKEGEGEGEIGRRLLNGRHKV